MKKHQKCSWWWGRVLFSWSFHLNLYLAVSLFQGAIEILTKKGIQKHWFLYIIKKAAKGCIADLLLAYKPVQQVAITVHVAILTLQACLVSHTRHLNPPTGTNKFQETKKLGYHKYLKKPQQSWMSQQVPEKSKIKKLIQTLGSC